MRYFRTTDARYESLRALLDAAFGYPNAETLTSSTCDPASQSLHDKRGNAYLVIPLDYFSKPPSANILAAWLGNGSGVEVSQAEHLALIPPLP